MNRAFHKGCAIILYIKRNRGNICCPDSVGLTCGSMTILRYYSVINILRYNLQDIERADS